MAEADAQVTQEVAPEPEILLEEDAPQETDDELEIGSDKIKVDRRVKEAWNGLQKSVQSEKEAARQEREAVARERATFAETARVREALLDEVADLKTIDKQLANYKDMTPDKWVALSQSNPEAYQSHWPLYQALIAQRPQVLASAQAKAAELDRKQQETLALQRSAAEKELPTKIKNWSPELKSSLQKIALDAGVDQSIVEGVSHMPGVMSLLNEVAEFRAAKARAAAAKAKAAQETESPAPEPVKQVRATAGAKPDLRDNQSMAQFAATFIRQRKAHLSGRRT